MCFYYFFKWSWKHPGTANLKRLSNCFRSMITSIKAFFGSESFPSSGLLSLSSFLFETVQTTCYLPNVCSKFLHLTVWIFYSNVSDNSNLPFAPLHPNFVFGVSSAFQFVFFFVKNSLFKMLVIFRRLTFFKSLSLSISSANIKFPAALKDVKYSSKTVNLT